MIPLWNTISLLATAVLPAHGDGTFWSPFQLELPQDFHPIWIAAGSFNGDAKPDLAVVGSGPGGARSPQRTGKGMPGCSKYRKTVHHPIYYPLSEFDRSPTRDYNSFFMSIRRHHHVHHHGLTGRGSTRACG